MTDLKIKKKNEIYITVETEPHIKQELCDYFTFEVPGEVRDPNNEDGTTSFLRPMPGSARMYPETDIPMIESDVSNVKLPELSFHQDELY